MGTFSILLALCAGNSLVTDEFPSQRPVTQSFDVLFNLRLNERLNKQPWGWWFESPSCPLWRHSNGWLWYIHIPNFRQFLPCIPLKLKFDRWVYKKTHIIVSSHKWMFSAYCIKFEGKFSYTALRRVLERQTDWQIDMECFWPACHS